MTQAFNLSQFANFVNSSGQASLTTAVTGLLPVANGGTGTASPSLVGGTNISISGSFPNQTVTFSGSAGLTGFSTVIFTSSTTWSVPSGVTQARITVIGGGGAGAGNGVNNTAPGGNGGAAIAYCTGISGTLTITIGNGGAVGTSGGSGGTSSITGTGVSVSATGGGGGSGTTTGSTGSGTVTTGTALRSGVAVNTTATASGIVLNIVCGGIVPVSTGTQTWSASNPYGAGMRGTGGGSGVAGGGGVSGVVIIEY